MSAQKTARSSRAARKWLASAGIRWLVDRDLAGHGFLALGERERQDAVLEFRLRLVVLDLARQADAPGDGALEAFAAVPALALVFCFLGPASLDGEDAVVDLDRDVLALETRERGADEDVLIVLGDVERECVIIARALAHARHDLAHERALAEEARDHPLHRADGGLEVAAELVAVADHGVLLSKS